MVNWTDILGDSKSVSAVRNFVDGELSGKKAILAVGNPNFSRIVRSRGVDDTRTLARKALRRRDVV